MGCLYFWLTIGTTKDLDLLLDSSSSPLPVIGATISTTAFYLVAPLLLLGFYIYFHFYLQRLWEILASLPAIFQDGKRLDEKAYPWLLNGFVFSHFELLKQDRPDFAFSQNIFSVGMAWCAVPLTIFGFWWRYLSRHDWPTYFHIAFLSLSMWFGIVFYRRATATLRGEKRVSYSWKTLRSYIRALAHLVLIAIFSSSFYFISIKAMKAEFRPYFVMDIIKADLKGVDLSNTDLRGANIRDTSLVGANLMGADLQEAIFRNKITVQGSITSQLGADLSGADLRNANLKGADLELAALLEANLAGANLMNAHLYRANLNGTTFKNTKTDLTVEELRKRGAIVVE